MATVLICSLALAGCTAPATPVTQPAPTATGAGVAVAQPTAIVVEQVVTATPAPATPQPTAPAPVAKLVRNSPAGKCRWDVYISLSGFAPQSRIMVTSDYSEIECPSGKLVSGMHWEEPYATRTDANGRLIIAYLHEALGDYLYTFTDEQGHRASLPFSTLTGVTPEPTQVATTTARPTARPAASPTPPRTRTPVPTQAPSATATEPVHPELIVKSATLNLRSGPGQNYAVVGQVAQGARLSVIGRWGNCAWLWVAIADRPDFPWVAGGAQYVSLNVPCEAIQIETVAPPTETPTPPRPGTGLLSKAPSYGQGELLIRNGTDSDGVVILVDLNDTPLQAAYIRAADSFRMTQIEIGTYRLYFSKGEAWDAARKQFTVNVNRQRFADTLNFGVDTGYEVTLYGVAGGNAGTQYVPEGAFPAVP